MRVNASINYIGSFEVPDDVEDIAQWFIDNVDFPDDFLTDFGWDGGIDFDVVD